MKTHEHFDQLAERCYVKTGSVHTDHFDYVKFGELIIRECMDVVSDKCASPTAYNALAEHFDIQQ